MKQITILYQTLQSLISADEIESLLHEVGYRDTARKFNTFELLKVWISSAIEKWGSFRESEEHLRASENLIEVNYSTFSKKASSVPYSFFKKLLHLFLSRCNRRLRRDLELPPSIAVDSTTITTGAGNWKWAQFRGEKAGVKLHVSFDVKTMTPICVEESVASQHDSKKASQLVTMKRAIYICDRAYAKYDRMDELHGEDKFFVIRLKKNAVTRDERICSVPTKESFVREDWIARLGEEVNGTIHPFRLVTFQDLEGHEIRVVTNLYDVSAEAIAGMYRARWQVELFFRWMKQHLNVKRLFGTTPNAVYGQLYASLIAYALIQWLYGYTRPAFSAISKIVFLRKLWLGQLPTEWLMRIYQFLHEECHRSSL